jgi:hypothetical protein
MNWAREMITLTKEAGNTYKLNFGRRGTRAGVVDELGNPVEEIYIQRATDGRCYWSLSETVASESDAAAQRKLEQMEKVQSFIEKKESVTGGDLRSDKSPALSGISVNDRTSLADELVRHPLVGRAEIHGLMRSIRGKRGQPPKIYSIYPEPEGDGPISLCDLSYELSCELGLPEPSETPFPEQE